MLCDKEDPAKVLFVATVYTHLAAFHIPFMKLLQSWDYEVHAAASPAEGHRDEVEAAGIVCWDIPFERSATSLRNLKAYRELKALLKKNRYDLIHVHTPMAAWLGRLAAKRTGQGPVLYTVHGFHFYKGAPWPYWAFYYPAERLAKLWTDCLIVMNGEDFAQAKRMGFHDGKNLFFVHGVGVDLERFSNPITNGHFIGEELGLAEQDVVITCVAEFTATKNHALLLTAWKRVSSEEPYAHLLLVGEGRLQKVMESKAFAEGIPRVWFLGFRRDIPELLHATDIFVLPSRREGLPRVVMEAMAAGKPVVATDARGSRELVEHGVTGLLVKLGDVEGLAQTLLRLIRDPGLRERMGQAGQEKIKAYSIERVLTEMTAIYKQHLGDK